MKERETYALRILSGNFPGETSLDYFMDKMLRVKYTQVQIRFLKI